MGIDCCDICEKKTNNLVDYFCMLCQDCKKEYGNANLNLLKRIGNLMEKIRELKEEKEKNNET